jgi:D-serine deaminase-like pyridoxal phosphate-dependent protein
MNFSDENYITLRKTFKGQRLPLAFVDLDAFDANVTYAVDKARGASNGQSK